MVPTTTLPGSLKKQFERLVPVLGFRQAIERGNASAVEAASSVDFNRLVWSQVGVGLELQLRRSEDDRLLWRARHKARRSEGGLSLSPIGILVDTVFSSRFAADREVAESLADDAVRRMVFPLPNTRSF